ncbi:restriction endonuclease, partial [Pseudomonas neustonica]|uniref:restriction endonuclease n=1 Tax=Pseudomonas neustonica TaxID=2487346 RepID=UPI003F46F277
HTALTSAHRPRLIESTHTTTILTRRDMVLSLMQLEDDFLKHVGVHSVFLSTISPKLEEHLPILISKKDRNVGLDEFGETITKDWFVYLEKYYKDKIEPFISGLIGGIDNDVFEAFDTNRTDYIFWVAMNKSEIIRATLKNLDFFIEFKRPDLTPSNTRMSGVEYETKIANLVNENTTWNATLTKATGDQGADILLSKSQMTIIIQTKYYTEKVGNSAVQEAFSAKKFYGADLAFVISNSGFTKSAIELADATSVKLLSDDQLMDFLI